MNIWSIKPHCGHNSLSPMTTDHIKGWTQTSQSIAHLPVYPSSDLGTSALHASKSCFSVDLYIALFLKFFLALEIRTQIQLTHNTLARANLIFFLVVSMMISGR